MGRFPEELYVVIVDGGRSKIYADPDMREVLQCIKCGACLNFCPVWTKVRGCPYGWVYSGPIGSILNPLFLGLDRASDLYRATTLCGACHGSLPRRNKPPEAISEAPGKACEGRQDVWRAQTAFDGAAYLLPVGVGNRP